MDRHEAVALLEKRRNAWLAEDVEQYLSVFAEDFIFYANGEEQTRGRAELESTIRRNYEQFRPISWEFHEIAVHGSNVLGEWTVTLEDKATGVERSMKAMFICEIRHGLTTWVREYRWPTG